MSQSLSQLTSGPQQLALDIYSSLVDSDIGIVDSGKDFHLRKSSVLVDVSELGLLARRVVNGVYFLAQGSPDLETHSYDLRYFKWLINYANSNNNTHLKRVIREAQKSAVQVNVIDETNPKDDNWVSVPLLGAAGLKSGQILFKIPAELRCQLRDPEKHAFLSMRILAGFSSIYALELYERLSIFKSEGRSPWWSLDEFRSMVRVDGLKSANDFRYFRRDILDPAIDQINRISDIDVAMELRKTGRSYSHISFSITPSQGTQLLSSIESSRQMYEVLTTEFGLADKELDEISSKREDWTDSRIQEAIEFVRHRCRTSSVQYPGRYLMTALRDGYRVGAIEKSSLRQAENIATAAASAEAARLEMLSKSPVKPEMQLPTGEALEEAWALFLRSHAGRIFKKPAAAYELATKPEQSAFRGFLQAQ